MDPAPVKIKPLLPLALLVGFLPVLVVASQIRQTLLSQASSGNTVASVQIHPGEVNTSPGHPPTYLSALAYDSSGQPLFEGVVYEWGLSSTGSVGDLVPNANLATFTPLNFGSGSVWVKAYDPTGQAVGSVRVIVNGTAPTPTPPPLTSPWPSPEPTIALSPTPIPKTSTIHIYAAGTSLLRVYPTMQLLINNQVVTTWENVRGKAHLGEFIRFSHTLPWALTPNTSVKVAFVNDAHLRGIGDRNLRVDKIIVNDIEFQSESPLTFSQGGRNRQNKCGNGYLQTEWLLCNGFFEYTFNPQ